MAKMVMCDKRIEKLQVCDNLNARNPRCDIFMNKYEGVCEKINLAIGVIITAHRAARCGIAIFY